MKVFHSLDSEEYCRNVARVSLFYNHFNEMYAKVIRKSVQTYIIRHYSHVYDYFLALHTIYIVCIHFMHEWCGLQFKFNCE